MTKLKIMPSPETETSPLQTVNLRTAGFALFTPWIDYNFEQKAGWVGMDSSCPRVTVQQICGQ
jgi:hypothetical protein